MKQAGHNLDWRFLRKVFDFSSLKTTKNTKMLVKILHEGLRRIGTLFYSTKNPHRIIKWQLNIPFMQGWSKSLDFSINIEFMNRNFDCKRTIEYFEISKKNKMFNIDFKFSKKVVYFIEIQPFSQKYLIFIRQIKYSRSILSPLSRFLRQKI